MLPDSSSDGASAAGIPAALALQVLRLEQRLESYQRLHQQELDDLRNAVAEVKDQVLVLATTSHPAQEATFPAEPAYELTAKAAPAPAPSPPGRA